MAIAPSLAAKWVLSGERPDVESRDIFDAGQEPRGPRRYRATVTLGQPNVSVGLVFVQERRDGPQGRGGGGRGAEGRGAGGRGAGPAADAGAMARDTRFVEDPAKQPGNFFVSLPTDSTVELRIWPGENTSGMPIHTNQFNKVPQGKQGIPWNLERNGGGRVRGGRYSAVLGLHTTRPGILRRTSSRTSTVALDSTGLSLPGVTLKIRYV